jgi:hypothetical protein
LIEIFIPFRFISFHLTLFRSAPFHYIPSIQTELKAMFESFEGKGKERLRRGREGKGESREIIPLV